MTNNGSISAFDPPKKKKTNIYAILVSILASMNSILCGYDIGVMSGAQIYIKRDLKISDTQVEVLAGILNVYALIGSAAAGRTSDWIGRRYTVVVAVVIFFIGALLMAFSMNYGFLMFGRFITGIGVGFAMMIAPVYTTEVAPLSFRGTLSSFPEIFINFGILLGYVSNYAFSKFRLGLGWRLMLGAAGIPAVFLAFAVLFMPESPRWLVMQGRLGDAKKVLYKTSESDEEAEIRLADIKEAAHIPLDCNDDVVVPVKLKKSEPVWKELFVHPTPAVRHILVAGIGLHILQQVTGVDTVVLYSPRIFAKAGINDDQKKLIATMAVGLVKTSFILVAICLVDRFGRRKLLLTSVGGMVISLFALGLGLTIIDRADHKIQWAIYLCVFTVLSNVAFFSIGLGPVTWVYSSEIFPLKLRAQGVSVGVAVNRVMSGTVSMTFISLYKAITIGGAFFMFSGISVLTWIFFFTLLPETKGLALEDMESLFGSWCKWRTNARELKGKKRMDINMDKEIQIGTKSVE